MSGPAAGQSKGSALARLCWVLWACSTLCAGPAGAQSPGFDLQAHRGGRGEATEGSLRAFARSLELGVTTLELDVVLTGDDQPLVWHDQSIEPAKCVDTGPAFTADPRYPYVGKPVRELTLAQIRTLDCGLFSPQFPTAETVRGNVIATLAEVFALADSYRAEVRFDIETKSDAENPGLSADPQRFVDVILATARAAGRLDRIEIASFDWRILPLVHRAEPGVRLVALWDRRTWVPGSPWLAGIDPAAGTDPVSAAQAVGAGVLAPEHPLVTRELVQRAHAAGLAVVCWTVNDAETMRALVGLGVDGLITDHPALARSVLAELGLPLPPRYQRG